MKWRVVLYCLLGGSPLLIAALGAGHFAWWWASGILFAASFVPVALFGPRTALGQFAVIAPALLIVTALCTWSEALLFVTDPGFKQHATGFLVGSISMYMILAAVLALLGWLLKLFIASQRIVPHRSLTVAPVMILLSGLAYLFYYWVFGTITYQFFTKGYLPEAEHAARQLGLWFWGIQVARGVLMTLAVIPVIYTLRMKRWHAAIVVGLLIWIIGGLAPLVVPNPLMGGTQRFIHIVEIFSQNFLLGVTAVLLLRPCSAPATSNQPATVVGRP
jgi:hypothetical protein